MYTCHFNKIFTYLLTYVYLYPKHFKHVSIIVVSLLSLAVLRYIKGDKVFNDQSVIQYTGACLDLEVLMSK